MRIDFILAYIEVIFQSRNLSACHFDSFYLFGLTFSVKNYTLVLEFPLLTEHS